MFINLMHINILFLPVVFAIQYANYFKVNSRDFKSLPLKNVVHDIWYTTHYMNEVRLNNEKIMYNRDNQTYTNTLEIILRKIMLLLYTDMQIFFISEIDKIIKSKSDQMINLKKNSILKHIDAIFPGCYCIPYILDYLYNKDVDFEDLLGLFYALCIVPRNYVEYYFDSLDYESTRTNNLYTNLRKFLLNKFGKSFVYEKYSLKEIDSARGKFNNWNLFLEEVSQKLKKFKSSTWIVPERLTFSFLMRNNIMEYNKHIQLLLKSPVEVNDIYKTSSVGKRGLQELYRNIARFDVNPNTLLTFYNIVLKKMNEIFDLFLYRHLLIFYIDIQSVNSTNKTSFIATMKGIMSYCNWKAIFDRFRDLLLNLKHTFTRTFNQSKLEQCILSNILLDNHCSLTKIKFQNATSITNVLSTLLYVFPSNLSPELITNKNILLHNFTIDLKRTEKLMKQNYADATNYVNELISLCSKNINIQYAVPFLKKYFKLRFESTCF
ncbi:uncharacterized protein LOC126894688 isoform X2 [Daktulosphaira vitifoliae]|uniref:uncharacterized protein LOC126894688 isoform X2 n=1 Tax=Daktulosphaira vitifoliae TaxID=58002 RepID=UPI0021AA890A|nr:uncharacterized protein LOC126894688 isoform X2 [Daktulosphaira vitifoliae]